MDLFLQSPLLLNQGFQNHGFTEHKNYSFQNQTDGPTASDNLLALKEALGTDKPLVRVSQVHGATLVDAQDVLDADGGDWTISPSVEADGIFSGDFDGYLGVQTADCVPLLIGSRATGEVASIHAGWKGTAKGIVRDSVKKMFQRGSDASSIFVAIGPCICIKCYEVGEEVARHFPESCDPVKRSPGKFMLDLGLAVEVSLLGTGLSTTNIERIEKCTCCGGDSLFSYRGSDGKCGRQLAFISR